MAQYNLISLLEEQRKNRYQKARKVTEKLVKTLVGRYHVKKIVLVGSILNEDRFHEHSDIDLCVAGLSDKDYFQALGELTMEAGEFNIDLIPIEDASERMRDYISKGEVLYER